MSSVNEKKKALLAYKEKLLKEIQYYDKSIEDFRAKHKNNSYYDGDSSDSEDNFPNTFNSAPEVSQLKLQQSTLKTCLQATQELTSLTIVQSEVNVLVRAPELDGERPVTEKGTWKEVIAECRIDLVPFTIAFFKHTPDRKFSPISSRKLQVSLVKAPHEAELAKSVLNTLKRPSDAIEVIRSYASAYRSRRTTLARLVNKYASSLFMEPHPEGGFVLKCANLLEILWRLENKWSPVAPFHHRLKFDLEYMDEFYIKIITQAHKQLLDPSIQTDERTLLLSKIITTCLQARGPVDSESDLESRQTEPQAEIEAKDKDSEVMAPPKSLPKKSKKVSKDNKDTEKDKAVPQKRSVEDDIGKENSKKMKTNEEGAVKKGKDNVKKVNTNMTKNKENIEINTNKKTNNDNDGIKKKPNENTEVKKVSKKTKQSDINEKTNNVNENNKNVESAKVGKKRKNDDNQTDADKPNEKVKKVKSAKETRDKNAEHGETQSLKANSNVDIAQNNEKPDSAPKIVKSKTTIEEKNKKVNENKEVSNINKELANNNNEIPSKTAKESKKNVKNTDPPKKIDKKSKMSIANDKKDDIITKRMTNIDNQGSNTKPKKTNRDQVKNVATSKKVSENKDTNKNIDTNDAERPTKNVASLKNVDQDQVKNVAASKKLSGAKEKNTKADINDAEQPKKNVASVKNVDKNQVKNVVTAKKIIEKKKTVTNDAEPQKKSVTSLKNVDKDQVKKNANSKKVIENKNTNLKSDVNNAELQKKNVATIKNPTLKQNSNKNPKSTETLKTSNKNGETIIKVTEKNANNINNKNKISLINNKLKTDTHKITKINHKLENNLPKLTVKSTRNLHKSPSHKNALKSQNIQKSTNTKWSNGNTKIFTGNTEKENGGKSKIPQKKTSIESQDNNFKKNMLRISPRKLPSKFKTISQDSTKNMMKFTNIPRLMKKPVPKISE